MVFVNVGSAKEPELMAVDKYNDPHSQEGKITLLLSAVPGGWDVTTVHSKEEEDGKVYEGYWHNYTLSFSPVEGQGFRYPAGGGDPTPAGWHLQDEGGYYLQNVDSFEDGLCLIFERVVEALDLVETFPNLKLSC